jgi:hypothetical protein
MSAMRSEQGVASAGKGLRRVLAGALGIILACISAEPVRAQARPTPVASLSEAREALIAVAHYMVVDAGVSSFVGQPSARALLSQRPGAVLVSVVAAQVDIPVSPADAQALAAVVAQSLSARGLSSAVAGPGLVNTLCPIDRDKGRQCTFAAELGLIISLGYPEVANHRVRVAMSSFTDISLTDGEQIRSNFSVFLERQQGAWQVVEVRRLSVAGADSADSGNK